MIVLLFLFFFLYVLLYIWWNKWQASKRKRKEKNKKSNDWRNGTLEVWNYDMTLALNGLAFSTAYYPKDNINSNEIDLRNSPVLNYQIVYIVREVLMYLPNPSMWPSNNLYRIVYNLFFCLFNHLIHVNFAVSLKYGSIFGRSYFSL